MLSLLNIGLAFFVIAVSPGPANISNATIAMSLGRKISLIYGAGLSVGLVFWGLVAASGFGMILQSSVYLLMTLKVFGGLYLLWLFCLLKPLLTRIANQFRQKTAQRRMPAGLSKGSCLMFRILKRSSRGWQLFLSDLGQTTVRLF